MPRELAERELTSEGPRRGPDSGPKPRRRSVTLNLTSEEGQELARRMIGKCDVVVENFRPDVKNRLGIDYKSLKAINPGIILASISGFGQDGPYANRPGFA